MSVVIDESGGTRWLGSSADGKAERPSPVDAPVTAARFALPKSRHGPGQPRGVWLSCFVALVALLVLGNLVADYNLGVRYGWDVRVNCAAVDAHVEGRDPYFVKNLKGTRLSYPYLPVTLDAFRPLCAGGFLPGHYRGIFFVLAVLCGWLLPGLGTPRQGLRDAALRILCALGGFIGFEWTLASGNFTIFSGLLTALALALLFRRTPFEEGEEASFALRLAGAAVLGFVTSLKLVFFPVLAALYFLPQNRRRKFVLIAAAAGAFMSPILISRALYPELFQSWLAAISGQIPGQHSVALYETNPSLLLLARELAGHFGLADSRLVVFAGYGIAATALVLAPFALFVLRAAGGQGEGWPLKRLDRWLMDHPREAMRMTVLAMYALYLCTPRLKEYALFELAIYLAVLIVDLRPAALAAALIAAIGVPTWASISGIAIEGSYIQLVAALVCFWILLLDFDAASRGAGSRNRTGTALSHRGILSPLRLPIPPCPPDPTRSNT